MFRSARRATTLLRQHSTGERRKEPVFKDMLNGEDWSTWEGVQKAMGLNNIAMRRFYFLWVWGGVTLGIVYYSIQLRHKVEIDKIAHETALKLTGEMSTQGQDDAWVEEKKALMRMKELDTLRRITKKQQQQQEEEA